MSRAACPGLEALSAFMLGNLPEPELGEMAEHLDECTRCAEQAGELDGVSDIVLVELRRIAHLNPNGPWQTNGAPGLEERACAETVDEQGATGVTTRAAGSEDRALADTEPEDVPAANVTVAAGQDDRGFVATAVGEDAARAQTARPGPTPQAVAVTTDGGGAGTVAAASCDLVFATEMLARWDDYRIVREIGRGGMGVVYEAYQGSLNRHVALKLLPERGNLARFRREAKAAGRLHHTHIVPVFGVGEHHGQHFYVMQYIDGRGLATILKEREQSAATSGGGAGRFGYHEAARIGAQAAEALAYAHTQGIVHRDITPSNLLIDNAGDVWVTDFGLAKDADDVEPLTQSGDVLGTPR